MAPDEPIARDLVFEFARQSLQRPRGVRLRASERRGRQRRRRDRRGALRRRRDVARARRSARRSARASDALPCRAPSRSRRRRAVTFDEDPLRPTFRADLEGVGTPLATSVGFCWSLSGADPAAASDQVGCVSLTAPSIPGPFSAQMTGTVELVRDYRVVAFAESALGRYYSDVVVDFQSRNTCGGVGGDASLEGAPCWPLRVRYALLRSHKPARVRRRYGVHGVQRHGRGRLRRTRLGPSDRLRPRAPRARRRRLRRRRPGHQPRRCGPPGHRPRLELRRRRRHRRAKPLCLAVGRRHKRRVAVEPLPDHLGGHGPRARACRRRHPPRGRR